MTENLKKFLELLSRDEALCAKASSADKSALVAMAREIGFELTEADFVQPSAELSDDELDTVAGGWKDCVCAFGGGGKADADGEACACVAVGVGRTQDCDAARCACTMAGFGDSPSCMGLGSD